ncbi:error-prone DNA polymerase [Helcobacillus massiliensis]|uniref:error-prone DNA polymerase n=1 Tax=Helcobacillus massiliensis TaxID=521392 RepID=UPI0029532DA8|nr:error-prone DNA polymerase [Helcobacillus massiliensis]WOO93918.1 error-prone DNA polymerase [Helcobacillus massiliensis]
MTRWFLGPPSWRDLEAVLSDRSVPVGPQIHIEHTGEQDSTPTYEPERAVPYAELHAHSHFSFLDGASSPEDLVAEAHRLGLDALALTDHNGFYGAIRFAQAAREHNLRTVYGAELTLPVAGSPPSAASAPRTGSHDPQGEHLLVLARSQDGYRRLSAAMARAHLDGADKGEPRYNRTELQDAARGGHWLILTGCRKGAVQQAVLPHLATGDIEQAALAAAEQIERLVDQYGTDAVVVELPLEHSGLQDELHDALAQGARIARESTGADLPLVATGNVHYAAPTDKQLADVHASLRAGQSLEDADPHLPSRLAHLRSGEEMAHIHRRYPQAVANAAIIGRDCAIDLTLLAPDLPPCEVPDGHTEATWLRELTHQMAQERYGPRGSDNERAWTQIEHELRVITDLHFPGYFLIVEDIIRFCRDNEILAQGRGSAANSAVCYALGITAVDPVMHGLLFERFLAPERDGPPDIDIDIASDRREEVIQYVYRKYGRQNAAQVANVITYRARMAVRDASRALGYAPGQQDAFARRIERSFTSLGTADLPEDVQRMARRLRDAPRHLGIHSGGMVLCDRPVIDVVPVERARMVDRTVVQWDKDDCADAGLVKFDLLGLGMLTALDHCLRILSQYHGEHYTLATLPQEDPAVYDMLCAGDSVGVFQVESRAQISTLPRLRPREFYDLVVEVALVRPGPIQGGSVHPYIRRRMGEEEISFAHPRLEKSLGRTLGVPLFQEQLMQMVVDVADFSAAQADQLRRAMGSKRSSAKVMALRAAMFDGMANNGIDGEAAEMIYRKILAFANYGFPESHAYSFAYLVYASAFLKAHFPAAFTAALLRSQPMGFYSPQSLVADARRHGVVTLGADLHASDALTTLELTDDHRPYRFAPGEQVQGERAAAGPAIRLGLSSVRGISTAVAERIVDERAWGGRFASVIDLARRVRLSLAQLEALATAGALDEIAGSRRAALWAAGIAAHESPGTIPGVHIGADAPMLPGMSDAELMAADTWATGISPAEHPVALLRDALEADGVHPIARLRDHDHGTRLRTAGIITHRQRPATASGATFLSLEDETGILNVICSRGFWGRHRAVLRTCPAVVIRGRLEKSDEGVISVLADDVAAMPLGARSTSRNFC